MDIGHNSEALYTSARATALDAISQRRERLDEIMAALDRISIQNRGDAQLAVDRVGIARDFSDLVLQDRDTTRKPYQQAREAIDAAFLDFIQPLLTLIESSTAKVAAYHETVRQAERDRVAAQALEIPDLPPVVQRTVGKAAVQPDAIDPPAQPRAAPVVKQAPIRGLYGKKLINTERNSAVLEDLSLVPDWIMNATAVREAIEKVATSMLKQHPEIPGFRIQTSEKARIG
jgi:hypothetical protein